MIGADNVTPLRRRPSPQPDAISDEGWKALQQLVNHEAEQGLLGALLVNNRAYDSVGDVLSFDDFYHALHGQIYAAIGSLIAAGNVADPVSLRHYFAGDEALDRLGGAGYLATLAASAVSILNAPFYAQTIRDLAQRRRLVEKVDAIRQDAATNNDPERDFAQVMDEAEQQLYALTDERVQGAPSPIDTIVGRTLEDVQAAYQRAASGKGSAGLETGLADVDKIVRGIEPGDLVVLGGRPSMGKSACGTSILLNCGKAGKRGVLFSLEMTGNQTAQRWFAAETGITTDRQRQGEVDGLIDFPALIEARSMLGGLPIHIDDQPRLSVAQIRQRARRLKRRYTTLDLIVIDHLQLIRQGGRQESRRVEIGDITGHLKAIAKELETPILLLSQINRAVEAREDKRPTLADLKESGDIEQDADIVLLLYREAYYLERQSKPVRRGNESDEQLETRRTDHDNRLLEVRSKAELIIAKNRLGRTGLAHVRFDGKRQKFENLYEREIT